MVATKALALAPLVTSKCRAMVTVSSTLLTGPADGVSDSSVKVAAGYPYHGSAQPVLSPAWYTVNPLPQLVNIVSVPDGALPRKYAAVRLEQSWNALSPMLVTLLGMVTPISIVLPANAPAPIPVTECPPNVSGMVTAPP